MIWKKFIIESQLQYILTIYCYLFNFGESRSVNKFGLTIKCLVKCCSHNYLHLVVIVKRWYEFCSCWKRFLETSYKEEFEIWNIFSYIFQIDPTSQKLSRVPTTDRKDVDLKWITLLFFEKSKNHICLTQEMFAKCNLKINLTKSNHLTPKMLKSTHGVTVSQRSHCHPILN